MAKRKRLNRTSDMDDALFEALKTAVPEKNTGPDPDDILGGLFDDEEGGVTPLDEQAVEARSLVIDLDGHDREQAEGIVQFIREQTGEHIDYAQVLKTALYSCPPNDEKILEAYRLLCARKNEKE